MEASTAEVVSAVANCFTVLAGIGALAVASQGLSLWREQLIGNDEYEITKRLIGVLLAANRYTASVIYELLLSRESGNHLPRYYELCDKFANVESDVVIVWGQQWYEDNLIDIQQNLREIAFPTPEAIPELAKALSASENQINALVQRLRHHVLKARAATEGYSYASESNSP